MKWFAQKEKVFCIGRNKTGTTSLEAALKDFKYRMGDQKLGERLVNEYANGNFKPVLKLCKTADAFQDAPFSWPYTWLILYHYYPNAKFILTVRDEEKWYESVVSFHSKQFKNAQGPLTKEDMKEVTYIYKGWLWEANRAIWKTPEDDIYKKDMLIANYRRHNEDVQHFFRDKNNLLVLDVSKDDAYSKLCSFLDKPKLRDKFPHKNAR
ncbi:hypothetical protein GCM10009117_03890 [Gangjinia marincola]|uniref:Sulfotransferase family protein n=1 Tax=Gangjinia marincola TaxID=578463 RepID=A0ABP3XPJ6_9FLAO